MFKQYDCSPVWLGTGSCGPAPCPLYSWDPYSPYNPPGPATLVISIPLTPVGPETDLNLSFIHTAHFYNCSLNSTGLSVCRKRPADPTWDLFLAALVGPNLAPLRLSVLIHQQLVYSSCSVLVTLDGSGEPTYKWNIPACVPYSSNRRHTHNDLLTDLSIYFFNFPKSSMTRS